MAPSNSKEPPKKRRKRVSQTDVPRVSLEQALRVPAVIAGEYAKEPTKPLDVAHGLNMSPTSGGFRDLCGAAIGYGLTEGGPNASEISLTSLGRRIVAPTVEGDDLVARQQAALVPTVEKQFLEKYDGSSLPTDRIAFNVLEGMGVPREATQRVHGLILGNAKEVGLLKQIKDKTYVDLSSPAQGTPGDTPDPDDDEEALDPDLGDEVDADGDGGVFDERAESPGVVANRRVFVSHGKNRKVVAQLKELMEFGDFEPVVSVERESVSKPVPEKVLDDMRGCSAGIIHVSPEERLLDSEGEEQRVLNQNVLIEIGAAMALYKGRFILLVEEGTTMPSNLRGLYEVRYSGDELGYDATMKVLKALNQFKAADA